MSSPARNRDPNGSSPWRPPVSPLRPEQAVSHLDIANPAASLRLSRLLGLTPRLPMLALPPLWHWLYGGDAAAERSVLTSGVVRWRQSIPMFASLRLDAARRASGRARRLRLFSGEATLVEELQVWGEPRGARAAPAPGEAVEARALSGETLAAAAALLLDLAPRHYDRGWRAPVAPRWAPAKLLAILMLDAFSRYRPGRQVSAFRYRLHGPILEDQPFTVHLGGDWARTPVCIQDARGQRAMTAVVQSVC